MKTQAFPIEHELFQYAPSSNPYWGKIKERSLENPPALTDHDTETLKGRWHERSEGRPIVLEIGCNGGHFLNPFAQRNPQLFCVGVDWKFKQIYFAREKAARRGILNTTYLRAHAGRLPYIFGPGEVSELRIYFPDPWPKRSQRANRLLSREWFLKTAPLMTPNGLLHFKTDHHEYFDSVCDILSKLNHAFRIESIARDIHRDRPDSHQLAPPVVTLFEQVFIRDGLPVFELYCTSVAQAGNSTKN